MTHKVALPMLHGVLFCNPPFRGGTSNCFHIPMNPCQRKRNEEAVGIARFSDKSSRHMWRYVKIETIVEQTTKTQSRSRGIALPLNVHIAVFTLDAGPLARCQCSEGPATDHLDTGFLAWFPCVLKLNAEMVPKYPRCHYMLLM